MSIWDDIGNTVEDIGEGAVDLAEGAVELAEDAWDAATGAAEDAGQAVGNGVSSMVDALGQAVEDAMQAAAKAAEDAAKAMEQAVNDTYEWGRGAADTVATGAADAADWSIGAFETVGKAFVEDIDWEEFGAEFSSGAIEFANRFFGGGDTKKFEDKSFASDGTGPYFAKDAGSQFANGGGEDEPIGRVGQALGSTNPGPDLSNIVTTLEEARAHTGFGGVPLVEGEGEGGSSFAQLLSDGHIADQPEGPLGDASDAGIIVVGGHEVPGEAFTAAYPRVAAVSVVAGIAQEHRELARETLEGVELPNTSLQELADRELFNERPFELPGLDGPFGGRDLLGWLDGEGGYGGPNGPGGIPGGLGGQGGPGGFEGLPGWLGGRGGMGDLGAVPGGFGGPGGDGAPIGEGGFGGELGGFGGLPGWVTGNGKGGLDGLFGGGPRDWGSAGGFGGIDPGGSGGIDGLGIGLPPDLGGSRMPDIKLKGEDAMWHEEGNKVVADKGETLQVERGNKSFTVNEGKSFEKQEGDQFVSNKEPNTYYHVSDGKVEKVGGGTADSKPHPGDPKGMPADGDSGGGPNWSPYAMPADDGSGGGPNWSFSAMPADDGSGGGPVWSTLMPADDSVGGGGPNWSLHDSFAVAALADTQPTTGDHQFASAFSVIDSHFSHDSLSAIGSHLWF